MRASRRLLRQRDRCTAAEPSVRREGAIGTAVRRAIINGTVVPDTAISMHHGPKMHTVVVWLYVLMNSWTRSSVTVFSLSLTCVKLKCGAPVRSDRDGGSMLCCYESMHAWRSYSNYTQLIRALRYSPRLQLDTCMHAVRVSTGIWPQLKHRWRMVIAHAACSDVQTYYPGKLSIDTTSKQYSTENWCVVKNDDVIRRSPNPWMKPRV